MMATADLTPSRPVTRHAMRFSLWACGFVVLAVACHALISSDNLGEGRVVSGRPDTLVFAGVAGAFVFLNLLAQIPVTGSLAHRRIAHQPSAHQTSADHRGAEAVNPVAALLIGMTIRFIGTFMVLAALLSFQLVGQNEAVFDVLFWYVTLTTIEVIGIVWASKPSQSTSTELGSVTKGV